MSDHGTSAPSRGRSPVIERVETRALEIPTVRAPETDGTAAWSSTTMVVVQLYAGGISGLGYSYVDAAATTVIDHLLAPCVRGADAYAIPDLHGRMIRSVRNQGREGIAACAISAVDTALWDLKARLLGVSVSALLGPARDAVPVYASGGFTSTPLDELEREIAGYVAAGHRRIKIKIGRPRASALERVRILRGAAGPGIELMVDGNGAYTRKEAVQLATELEELSVSYFEEPVSSDDLDGLRLIRDATQLAVAAGEYGYGPMYVRRMLEANAIDIQQADATRCLGFTGFLEADSLCDAFGIPLSAHCAPALHVHVARSSKRLAHIEHFFDHVRIENLLFEGTPTVSDGALTCDWQRPGLGLELRSGEAARFAA